jgi:hypothetical protein
MLLVPKTEFASLKTPILLWIFLLAVRLPVQADFTIAQGGKARCVIVEQAGATLAESNAVRELAGTLCKITGATFEVREAGDAQVPKGVILVGPGAAATALFPELALDKLGSEELVMKVKGGRLLLAGGRPRGTVYAVNRFLQDECGVRWWAPWATTIPNRPTLRVPKLEVRSKPVFEYRAPFWWVGQDPVWKAHNAANGESAPVPEALGGCIKYKGFCHTFYALVPPDKYFQTHPEWYSLLNGVRTHKNAQLCLSNQELRDFVVQQVKAWLREAPDAKIISVTQNDCAGPCRCPQCKAIDEAEGSPSGCMLSFVNYIAEKIEPEFPDVAVDTFAYQYTRHPPKTIVPRPNVIVRLCSIECNFREPLDHPSNATFLADLKTWSKICRRLYVWDYVTDFSNYVLPHPNYYVLGPNMRLFQRYGVKGIFEEGAYGGPGDEMAELRSWVLAQLLWNPQQDDRALIREFVRGYYGPKAGELIQRYLEVMHEASKGYYLACFLRKNPPHLRFQSLAAAERLWQQAEEAASHEPDPDILIRVRMGHLPVQYACLGRWTSLRRECWEEAATWPWPESRKALADEFRKVCEGVPGKDWTPVKVLSEGGRQVEAFLKGFAEDPPDTNGPQPPKRLANPPPPADLSGLNTSKCIDLQDNLSGQYKPSDIAEVRPDPAASDLRAVWMLGNRQSWTFRITGQELPLQAWRGQWKVYAVVRVERESGVAPEGIAFTAGVYDNQTRTNLVEIEPHLADTGDGYRSYLLGTVATSADRDLWVTPAGNDAVKGIYVDRFFLVPGR